MKLKGLIDVMMSKDGDELLEETENELKRLGISMLNEDGSYKNTYTLLCEIAEVWNKEK